MVVYLQLTAEPALSGAGGAFKVVSDGSCGMFGHSVRLWPWVAIWSEHASLCLRLKPWRSLSNVFLRCAFGFLQNLRIGFLLRFCHMLNSTLCATAVALANSSREQILLPKDSHVFLERAVSY